MESSNLTKCSPGPSSSGACGNGPTSIGASIRTHNGISTLETISPIPQVRKSVLFGRKNKQRRSQLHHREKKLCGKMPEKKETFPIKKEKEISVDRSTVSRWASRSSGERVHANIRDTPCSGRPCTTRRPDNVQRVNMIVADKRVTVKELSLQVGIGEARDEKTTDQIRKLRWTTLKHPPYSPDLVPCDYHLFGKLKESLRGTRFEDDSLVHAAKEWLRRVGPDFSRAGPRSKVSLRQLKGTGIM
ncbi:hypothetical protein ANN_14614 [Periplaneta americana]|uniref:Uncharacterized protein n=1 Tax=Periplaneta americana TaxID=6978 RepID=A0ABQ8SYA4_PERAM|nr:hypothetical protein ANN_14614 [Periplaneta americana]